MRPAANGKWRKATGIIAHVSIQGRSGRELQLKRVEGALRRRARKGVHSGLRRELPAGHADARKNEVRPGGPAVAIGDQVDIGGYG